MTRTLDKSWTKKDFKIDWFSGTGSGGQHRNKHQNCVRITHIESGITRTGQSSRSREQNFREAFKALAEDITRWYYGDEAKIRAPVTEVIRTYNEAENRVTDHRTGEKFSYKNFDIDDRISTNPKSQ